jgi:hypothetical protein
MPPKMKIPEGEMTLAELKRTIKKYDELMSIETKGKSRDDLIKEIEKMGYTIDHENKSFKLTNKSKAMKRKPINVKMPPKAEKKPAKSKGEKDKDMREKVIKYIIANKDILDDERLK